MMQKKNDSKHENYFEWWAEEAIKAGFIKRIERGRVLTIVPKKVLPFVRVTKTKRVSAEKHLFHSHTYEWDYTIYWAGDNALHTDIGGLYSGHNAYFYSNSVDGEIVSYIDVKADRTEKSQTISFPINQKLVYDKFGMYVQKVVLYPANNSVSANTLFQKTWCPKRYVAQEVYKKDRLIKGTNQLRWRKDESKIRWTPVRDISEWLLAR